MVLALHSDAAASVPEGFSDTQVVDGLNNPTAMAFAPDGRLFVSLQDGQLRVIKDGALLPAPFITLTVDPAGERGLLGVAFDPDFSRTGYVYVYYTATTPTKHNRVSRFTADGDVAVAGNEVVILELDTLSAATNHNGGALHFGHDGTLYVAVGDNANGSNAQALTNPFGKLLRINADGSIPADNPFYLLASGASRAIWAFGLRNPFTFAFHADSGQMFINDVGEVSFEEINEGVSAANYGWPQSEGATSDPNHRSPIHVYGHDEGPFGGCAITGGAFYVPPVGQFPAAYVGKYFFADYCGGWIHVLDVADASVAGSFASGIASPVDLKVGPDGSLYYLARGSGSVRKISYTPDNAPVITRHPTDQTVPAGATATFSVEASGAEPLSYQWLRDGADVPGATSPVFTVSAVTHADNGAMFRARVTNTFGTVTSTDGRLTATSGSVPLATITSPAQGTVYAAGTVISYGGSGIDAEDGALPSSALTWQIDFHHDDHVHPFAPATTGAATGTFTIPQVGETSANVWYRLTLTVIDSDGASTTTVRDVHPRTVRITLDSRRKGALLTLDGQPVSAPHTFTAVVGAIRTIGAPQTQFLDGSTYSFLSWSDSGLRQHQVVVGTTDAQYVATVVDAATGYLYLSDLSWTSVTNEWGPVERDSSNGETAVQDGNPLSINGTVYRKGLGVHAFSELMYLVPPGCAQFRATVGVDDEVGANGSMTFEVWADGVRLFESGRLSGSTPGQEVAVDLSGHRTMGLVAGNAGDDIHYDHGDWADARFACETLSDSEPVYLSDLSWTSVINGWGPVERDTSNGETAAQDGGVISINGTLYEKGLGVHALSELIYPIPAGCTQFRATVGVDDEVGTQGSMTFEVWVDGVRRFESSRLSGGTPGQDVTVDITGHRTVSLVAGHADDDNDNDHGDWAGARFVCETRSDSRQVYVSDLSWTSVINGWGPVERDRSNGEEAAQDGGPISINGTVYEKGLGVHALSELMYLVPAECTQFRAIVGVDDGVGANGSMTFEVWAEGTRLFESDLLSGSTPGQEVAVDISGHHAVSLVARDGGDTIHNDHGDWADARFVCDNSAR